MARALWLLVGVGGFAGAVARYWIGDLVTRGTFPYGTLTANVLGSFLIGALLLSGLSVGLSPDHRALLAIGFLGAFTTMSTLSFETLAFFTDGETGVAVANILLNVLGSLAAVVAGRAVGIAVWGAPT